MISYRTKRSHTRSRINRIFPRVVFLGREMGVSVFSSLLEWDGISPVEHDFEWQSQRKNHQKWVFLCRQSFTLPKIYLVWRSSVLFLSLIGNYFVFLRSFPFYFLPIFDRESFFSFLFIFSFSFFSFLPFLSFHFSLSISFFGKSGFSIRYLLSLEEIPLSFASGERMRILFIGQGSK